MRCRKCESGTMEPMGYGDVMCSNNSCKHTVYSESDEHFRARYPTLYPKDENENKEDNE